MSLSCTCKSSILKLNFFNLNYEKLCLLKPNHHATKCPLHLMYNSISTTCGKFEIKFFAQDMQKHVAHGCGFW